MHREVIEFVKSVKKKHPKYFRGTIVIDVGSLNINGCNRPFFGNIFSPCLYLGVDLISGKNVDIVGKAHEVLPMITYTIEKKIRYNVRYQTMFDSPQPSVVISTECLEHDEHYKETLAAMYALVKKGGLMIVTCAAPGREPHGVTGADEWCSPATNDYYRNISVQDFASVLPAVGFSEYYLTHDKRNNDLQFMGIKL